MLKISEIILKGRFVIILFLIFLTGVMYYFAKDVRMSYQLASILPNDSQIQIDFDDFNSEFGESKNTMVIAVQDVEFFTKEHLLAWHRFGQEIESLEGVNAVLNITQLPILSTDSTKRKFNYTKWYNTEMNSNEIDSALRIFHDQKIYKDMLYNKDVYSALMLVNISKEILNTPDRKGLIDNIVESGEKYSRTLNNLDVRYSGMPYLRTIDSIKVKEEVSVFILLTLLITSLILYIFFRSFKATLISMIVVTNGVLFSFGLMGILEYDITALTALVPPVVIVIGIPNCIYLINKYHTEFRKNNDKFNSLHLMINKIGNITLLTNLTTASGFAAFVLTESETLQEFGLVASLSIVFIFLISILSIPIWFSFFSSPKLRHTKHLDKKWVRSLVLILSSWVKGKRKIIYIISSVLTIFGIIGLLMIETTGNITDDLSKDGDLYTDLQFFEKNFGGVMPLEIIIDARDTNAIHRASFMSKINELQLELESYEEFSNPFSYIEFIKYANQAYKNDGSKYYVLPQRRDLGRISSLIRKSDSLNNLDVKLTNRINSKARITLRMNDLATPQMDSILNDLTPKINRIFNDSQYDVVVTGVSRVFLEGTKFLVGNLTYSLLLVVILISIFMAWMFQSFRMVAISLIPNLLPLLLTSAIMGYFSIPIKPSTILVFSIAFGISVDDTIHFLAKYRQELILSKWNIRKSVFNALKETGVSMVYTSIVLFFGFFVFVASDFGGTVALGSLVSITLFFAMLSNLLLLPSLLLSLENLITTKSFKEPVLDIFDDESKV